MSDDLPTAGRFVDGEHRLPVRVYFEDTDLSGIVYHANYLRWMERGRSEMLRFAGTDQRAAQEAGDGAYAVSELSISYRTPAKLDDALIIVSRLIEIRPASCRIHQQVIRQALILAQAEVTAVFVAPSGKPRRQPSAWVAAFQPLVWRGEEQLRETKVL